MKCSVAVTVCTLLFLTACEKPSSGERELRQNLSPWFDALNLAADSPRHSLAPQIAHMQELRRKAEGIPVSKCMEKAKGIYIGYMNTKIQLLTQFMSGKDVYKHEVNDPKADFVEFDAATDECNKTS